MMLGIRSLLQEFLLVIIVTAMFHDLRDLRELRLFFLEFPNAVLANLPVRQDQLRQLHHLLGFQGLRPFFVEVLEEIVPSHFELSEGFVLELAEAFPSLLQLRLR